MKRKSFNLKKEIERLDPSQVGRSVFLFPEQIKQVARTFPRNAMSRRQWSSVLVCAMGGSQLGVDMLRYLYEPYLTAPIQIVNDYTLPAYVDRNTLVVTLSYSGTTEEIIACFKVAKLRHAGLFSISAGGDLAALARRNRVPYFVFTTENNPSGQPRIGTGYTMTAFYMLLQQQKLLRAGAPDLIAATRRMEISTGAALALAKKAAGNSFIVVGAEHLRGNAHVMANQINECTKSFASYFFIPELNHHLLEGLSNLKKAQRHWTALFLESNQYSPKIQKRFRVTEDVFKKQGFLIERLSFSGSRVEQSLNTLSFGSWFSYYGAIVLGIDPKIIPWVDYFKAQLK